MSFDGFNPRQFFPFLRKALIIRTELPRELVNEFIVFKDIKSIGRIQVAAWIGFTMSLFLFFLDYTRMKGGTIGEPYKQWLFYCHVLGLAFIIPALHISTHKDWIIRTRLRRGVVIWGMLVLSLCFMVGQSVLVFLDRQSMVMYLALIFTSGWMFAMSHKERLLFHAFTFTIMASVITIPDLPSEVRLATYFELIFLTIIAFYFDAFDFNLHVNEFFISRAMTEDQKKIKNLFTKYVPEFVVQKALKDQPGSIFEGELLHVAVLFCDIRDFTSLSEKLPPADVVKLLNTYYRHMTQVIRKYEGVVNQYVGDEIFVTFGAPVSILNCEEKAVHCALGMIKQLDQLNEELISNLGVSIKVGIGINYGPVIAGNLGTDDKIEYSVTGDTVNTGKRIESLTKEFPNKILISNSIQEKVKDLFTMKAWPPIEIKGKSGRIDVFEVMN